MTGVMNRLCEKDKNPTWLYCVPLLHFISGVCSPYEEIKIDLSHSETEPKWWGINGIEDVNRKFHQMRKTWTL